MVREDPHGLRKRPVGNDFLSVRRAGPRRVRLESWADPVADAPLAMDRAYKGDETRQLGPRPRNDAGLAAEGEQPESRMGV